MLKAVLGRHSLSKLPAKRYDPSLISASRACRGVTLPFVKFESLVPLPEQACSAAAAGS